MKKNNIQEKTWLGKFGDDYCKRNIVTTKEVRDCEKIFNDIFKKVSTKKINRVLEVGCNQGRNLLAMQNVFECECFGIEPNKSARESIKNKNVIISNNIVDAFADDIPFENSFFDLVFTSVVLIHIPNDKLEKCIDEIYRVSRNYILTIEYFSPNNEEIKYRGKKGLLFKRDYGSAFLDKYPKLKLIDYGFFWKRVTLQDNVNWWLFKKN